MMSRAATATFAIEASVDASRSLLGGGATDTILSAGVECHADLVVSIEQRMDDVDATDFTLLHGRVSVCVCLRAASNPTATRTVWCVWG